MAVEDHFLCTFFNRKTFKKIISSLFVYKNGIKLKNKTKKTKNKTKNKSAKQFSFWLFNVNMTKYRLIAEIL